MASNGTTNNEELIRSMEDASSSFFGVTKGTARSKDPENTICRMQTSKFVGTDACAMASKKRKIWTVTCIRASPVKLEKIALFYSKKKAREFEFDAHREEVVNLQMKFLEADDERHEFIPESLHDIRFIHQELDVLLNNTDKELSIECKETDAPSDDVDDE